MTETMQRAEPGAAQQTTVRPNRFVNASAEHVEQWDDSGSLALGAAWNNREVPANGYLSGILLDVTITGDNPATAANVAAAADAPWSVIESISLTDINGGNIVGPISGYDLYLINKYGGYAAYDEPTANPNFAAIEPGTGATAGSARFLLRVPVQINPRDAYGALPNMNAASTFKLNVQLAASGDVYSTAPSNGATVNIRTSIETWLVPAAVDMSNVPNMTTPPGLGTFQRWVKNTFTIGASGAQTLRMPNVSNMIRNLIFVYRDSTPARDSDDFPSSIELRIDGYARDQIRRVEQEMRMWEHFGYTGADVDDGVLVWDFTHELDGKAGFETRELWLPTNSATRLELVGNFGDSGQLTVLTNDVIVAGGPGSHTQAG